jgi:sulfite exporter TauE/SafE
LEDRLIQVLIEGFSLGISTGFYCLGACMPFFLPYLLVGGEAKLKSNLNIILEFLLGRMFAYISFAIVVSFLGIKFKGYVSPKLVALALILSSLLMIGYAFIHTMPKLDFCKHFLSKGKSLRFPLMLGFLIGFNPCSPFLVGMVRLLMLGSIIKSIILFFAFFIGTSIYIMPLVFVGVLSRIERIRLIGTTVAFITGFWFLMFGIINLIK